MGLDRVGVIGAGPAGSVTATVLARAGVAVDLIDASEFPREKACGDLLGLQTVEALETLELDHVLNDGLRIRGERYSEADGTELFSDRVDALDTPDIPLPVALPRSTFDAKLRVAAQAAGADLVRAEFTELGDERPAGRTVTLIQPSGETVEREYSFVIGADGARSRVARRAGLLPKLRNDHAVSIRQYVSTTVDLEPELLFFERDEVATGNTGPAYNWAFPVGTRRLNVGVYVCAPAAGRNLASRLGAFVVRLAGHLGGARKLTDRSRIRGGIVRYDFDPSRTVAPGVALVGDAAGIANVVLGEGICHAIRSGELVACVFVDHRGGTSVERQIAEALDSNYSEMVEGFRRNAHNGSSLFSRSRGSTM